VSKKLSWTFELFDRMSGKSKVISRHIADLDKKLRKASGATTKLERDTRKAGDSAKRAGEGWAWFGLKLGGWIYTARTALSLMGGLSRGLTGFIGAGIKAASFKESTMLGLNMMLRDPKKAKALYTEAVNFADVSPFETEETLQWYRQMVASGVGTQGLGTPGGSRVLKILAGLGDIASSQPNPSDAMGRIILQITQMMNKGRMLGNDLRPLAEAGVPLGLVYEKLAKRRGISVAEARSEKWEGKFGAGEGLEAVLEASAERYGGGTLGGGMGPASQTFAGLMSTLASRPYRMMEDIGESKGFKSLKAALKNLTDVLDPTTPTGARIKKNIENLFDRILGGVFKQFEDPKAVEAWINSFIAGVERIIPKIGEMAEAMGRMAKHAELVGRVLAVTLDPGGTAKRTTDAFGRVGAVELGEKGEVIRRLRALYGKGRLGPIERDELQMYENWAGRLGIPLDSLRAKPEAKPTGFLLNKGAIQIEINGAQDPKAVASELREQLASVFEGLAMQQGA
jgi:tape measure domain-containing protein